MIRINFGNYQNLLSNGSRIIYGGSSGTVKRDSKWNGGLVCNGRSIPNILEEYNDVYKIA